MMTPEQARAARAMLNLDMKSVCKMADVGKRTLTEFEAGHRAISGATRSKIESFYISRGIEFSDTSGNRQSVALCRDHIDDSAYTGAIREKREYYDFLGIHEIKTSLLGVKDALNSVGGDVSFTRKLLTEIMSKKNINQKELASILGCSAAFVSAMIVGKKRITPVVVYKLSQYFVELGINIKRLPEYEKNLNSAFRSIAKLASASETELNSLYDDHFSSCGPTVI